MQTVVLVIFDGFGVAPPSSGNAIARANMPTLRKLEQEAFAITLQASGVAVGLPWGEPGNSEVGHVTMGAGKIVYQYLPRIVFAIRDGTFFTNEALMGAVRHVKDRKSRLHLFGLISSGGVHAYVDHFYALLELAKREGVEKVFVHVFTDGRDAPPQEAVKFLPMIQERMEFLGVGKIATLCGRFYAMDRDGNWDRTQRTFELLTQGRGVPITNPLSYLEDSYAHGVTDEFIEPAAIVDERGDPVGTIQAHDAAIFFNFREDSARQLTKAFMVEDFPHFERARVPDSYLATMTKYEKDLPAPAAFPPPEIPYPLGAVIANAGFKQLRIAETEKYAHVTYFFNGGREDAFPQESRILIPSIDANFDTQPEMRAREITDEIVSGIERGLYSLIVANYANADMVGHTGNFEGAVRAAEFLDICLLRIVAAVEKRKSEVLLLLTSDHGNAEEMIDQRTGEILTEHSINPVPFIALGKGAPRLTSPMRSNLSKQEVSGFLADIAPTILNVLGIERPEDMTGRAFF